MSHYRAVWIVCDGGHGDRTVEAPDPRPTVTEARRRARDQGWTHTTDGRDLCPACSGGGAAAEQAT